MRAPFGPAATVRLWRVREFRRVTKRESAMLEIQRHPQSAGGNAKRPGPKSLASAL